MAPARVPTFPIVLAGFAAFLDLYATQPLLPLLARTFDASAFQVGLTVTAPVVAVAIAAPVVGRIADRVGLRRTILTAALLLTLATALAATAQSLGQLIFWRFLQGIVTPGIFASTIAYIHEVWPASRAGRGTASYMSGTVIGGFTGRAVAGVVAADATWHESFIALAILNGLVAVALWRWLPEPSTLARAAPPRASADRRNHESRTRNHESTKPSTFAREAPHRASADRRNGIGLLRSLFTN